MTGINRKVIGQFTVPRPSADEQVRLAADLERAHTSHQATIHAPNQQIDLLHEHRHALDHRRRDRCVRHPRGCGVTDTSADIEARRIEILRGMLVADKAAEVAALNLDVQRMAVTGVRLRYPDADDREVFLRVAALRNGRDLSVAAYGWDPDVEGW